MYGHDVEGAAPARPNLNRGAAGKGSAVLNSAFSGYDHAPAKHMGGRGFVLDDYAVANRSQRQIDAKVKLHRMRGPLVSAMSLLLRLPCGICAGEGGGASEIDRQLLGPLQKSRLPRSAPPRQPRIEIRRGLHAAAAARHQAGRGAARLRGGAVGAAAAGGGSEDRTSRRQLECCIPRARTHPTPPRALLHLLSTPSRALE